MEKMKESMKSVLPIALIVLAISVALTPLSAGSALLFAVGVFALTLGMALFNIGVDVSLIPIGHKIGSKLMGSKKIWLISFVSLILGIVITLAEPNLQILANLVSAEIQPFTLMLAVAIGVGFFLIIAMLRIVFRVPLKYLLIGGYATIFILCIFVPQGFLPLAFDSGGVSTGPLTVPFIMSLGIGVSSVRGGKNSGNDSFGLIALSSVGPVIAVQVLGIIFNLGGGTYITEPIIVPPDTQSAAIMFGAGLGDYALQVLIALSPILAFFLLSQLFTKAFSKRQFIKALLGFLYTFVGLTIFLTGANVGFLPIGSALGTQIALLWKGALIPVGMLLGYFIVAAEPAVYVLIKQVRQMSAGAITERSMKLSLCIGTSLSLGLAMVRVLTGISILWILIPGLVLALALTFFSSKLYTGIAFDSGGVASGAMVSAFVLPMAIGACSALGGDVFTTAFGCVAFVALTPMITIQILGILHKRKMKRAVSRLTAAEDGLTEYEVNYATETTEQS